jgi:hypothetical protein
VNYFKGPAQETGLPCQKSINLYLSRLLEEAEQAEDQVRGAAAGHD